jgi:hypothetical protein
MASVMALRLYQSIKELKRVQWLLPVVVSLLLTVLLQMSAIAQAVSWTEADLNAPPTAGSFSYGAVTPPTYTVVGSGAGTTGYTDTCAFAYAPTAGNIEIYGQVTSQSSTNSGASCGVMLRDSFSGSADMATVLITKAGALSFTYRTPPADLGSVTVPGPTVSLPVYVRLVRNGNTVGGYYSTDAETWNLIGNYTLSNVMPTKNYVGFCSSSTDSTLNTAVLTNVVYATSLPQLGSNLLLWLRADNGVTASSGLVSSWTDQSGNSLTATQSVTADKPTLTASTINHSVLPTVSFNGTSTYLSSPTGFAGLNTGYSAFIVCKPANGTSTGDLCSMGNASNSDAIIPQIINTNAKLFVYNGATASSVVTTTTPISSSNYQLLEETVQPGATNSLGTIFVNGAQAIQSTTLNNPNNISRTSNLIGAGSGPASWFNGGIAEILIYNTALSASQRAALESYVLSKYGVGTQPTLDTPTFSPSSGIFTPGQLLTIAQDQNATVYFTQDGSTPVVASSQWLNTTPITLSFSETVKALAVAPFFNNSAIATATYELDPSTLAIPRTGLALWLRADSLVSTTSGSNVTSWGDSSASLNTASQSVTANQPVLVANAVNGLPAVNFTGSKFLQLPAGMANFTSGASLFVLMSPTSVTAGARVLDLGNGATSDNLQLQLTSSTGAALYVYTGATASNVTSTSAISLGRFQLLEAIHNGSASASIFTNGLLGAQGTVNNITNILRNNNYVGQGSAGGNSLNGQIAELILFNRAVTESEQATIEGYFLQRYQALSVNTTPAPKFNVAAGTLTAPTQIELEAPAAAKVYITVDGTTPSTSSPLYVKGVNVYFTQTVKAIAVINGVSSSVASAIYTLDATQFPAPASTTTPLQLDLQLPNPSIPQDSNQH